MDYTIKQKGDVVKIKASQFAWSDNVKGKTLAKVTDTGNGYIAHFKSFSSARQDSYVCLAYDEADYLLQALLAFQKAKGGEE